MRFLIRGDTRREMNGNPIFLLGVQNSPDNSPPPRSPATWRDDRGTPPSTWPIGQRLPARRLLPPDRAPALCRQITGAPGPTLRDARLGTAMYPKYPEHLCSRRTRTPSGQRRSTRWRHSRRRCELSPRRRSSTRWIRGVRPRKVEPGPPTPNAEAPQRERGALTPLPRRPDSTAAAY